MDGSSTESAVLSPTQQEIQELKARLDWLENRLLNTFKQAIEGWTRDDMTGCSDQQLVFEEKRK